MFDAASPKYPDNEPKTKAKPTNILARVKKAKFGRIYRSTSHEGSLLCQSISSPTSCMWPDATVTTVFTTPSTPNLLSPASTLSYASALSYSPRSPHFSTEITDEIGTPTRSDSRARRSHNRRWVIAPPDEDLALNARDAALQRFADGVAELIKLVDAHLSWTCGQDNDSTSNEANPHSTAEQAEHQM